MFIEFDSAYCVGVLNGYLTLAHDRTAGEKPINPIANTPRNRDLPFSMICTVIRIIQYRKGGLQTESSDAAKKCCATAAIKSILQLVLV